MLSTGAKINDLGSTFSRILKISTTRKRKQGDDALFSKR